MKVEVLFPEVANLYGDLMNVEYLRRSCGEIEIVNTSLRDEPLFMRERPVLIYMGSVTEEGMELAAEALRPCRERLRELIDDGQLFLITGNALELFGEGITADNGWSLECLGLFPTRARYTMMSRYNALYLGKYGDMDIVGFKSLFGHSYGEVEPLFETVRGDGLNEKEKGEGIRRSGFMATCLTGPLLVLNPPFARELLRRMGVEEPHLAFEEQAMELYRQRVAQYSDPNTGIVYH